MKFSNVDSAADNDSLQCMQYSLSTNDKLIMITIFITLLLQTATHQNLAIKYMAFISSIFTDHTDISLEIL